ncbi:hypothetical protein [Vibrio parahaemolyticus]|uniref:hypothetical protein n=1 Tax=Vibrio parahaemolyticus TaxID=670 RepID=UPI003D8130A2
MFRKSLIAVIAAIAAVAATTATAGDIDARLNGVVDYLFNKQHIDQLVAVQVDPATIKVTEVIGDRKVTIERTVSLDDQIFHQLVVGTDARYDWEDLNTKRYDDRPWKQSELIINYLEKFNAGK